MRRRQSKRPARKRNDIYRYGFVTRKQRQLTMNKKDQLPLQVDKPSKEAMMIKCFSTFFSNRLKFKTTTTDHQKPNLPKNWPTKYAQKLAA